MGGACAGDARIGLGWFMSSYMLLAFINSIVILLRNLGLNVHFPLFVEQHEAAQPHWASDAAEQP
jgi:hypothetical protein